MRRRDEVDEVAPRARFAAGEMHLQTRRVPAASSNTRAQVGVSSSSSPRIERERIRAIRAAQRTAVRQFGKQAERVMQGAFAVLPAMRHSSRQLLVGEPAQHRRHVGKDRSRGAVEGFRQIVDDGLERRLAGAALDDLGGDGVGLEHALRRQQHPAALRLVVHQPHAARQARAGIRGDAGAASFTVAS